MLVLWLATGVLAHHETVTPDDTARDPGAGGAVQRHRSSPYGEVYSEQAQRKKWIDEARLATEIGEQLKGKRHKLKTVKRKLRKAVENTHTEYVGGLLQTAATIAAVPNGVGAKPVSAILADYQRLQQEAQVLQMQLQAIQAAAAEYELAMQAAAEEEAAIVALLLF